MSDTKGGNTSEKTQQLWRDLVHTSADMCVHFGLFCSVLQGYPPHVRDGLNERMEVLIGNLQDEIKAVQYFAEAYDD